MDIATIILVSVLTIISVILLIMNLTKKDAKTDIKDDLTNLKIELDNKISNSVSNSERNITTNIHSTITQNNQTQKDAIDTLTNTVNTNLENFKKELENIRRETSESLKNMMETNDKKLNEINSTVSSKLETTLEARLKESFSFVQQNLNSVQEALGQMNSVATEVGGLKKVLSGTKTRGIFGEVQLKALLDEILAPDQYVENVVTIPNSRNPVEFAIKFPGPSGEEVLLPIDSKFSLDRYSQLEEAYESCDEDKIKAAKQLFKNTVMSQASDIKTKYIEAPRTTEFGIMFVPTEGIYAEIIKQGIADEMRNKHQIVVSGPTTMAALLNSFQMGFKTLAIQKKTTEVWHVLKEVDDEFKKFADALNEVQKKINQAGNSIDTLITTRTKAMNRKLRQVQQYDFNGDNELDED